MRSATGWLPVAGRWSLGHGPPLTGHRLLVTGSGHRLPVTGYKPRAPYVQATELQATGHGVSVDMGGGMMLMVLAAAGLHRSEIAWRRALGPTAGIGNPVRAPRPPLTGRAFLG